MDNSYIRTNFAATAFTGYEKWNKSLIGWVRNCLVRGINDNNLALPRYVVVVLDNEIIKATDYEGFPYSVIYECQVEWLARQIGRVLDAAKDALLAKAKRRFEPQMIWMEAPQHAQLCDNFKRQRLNEIIKVMAEIYQEVHTLKPLKGWNPLDINLISTSRNSYSAEGIARYLMAIDNAIRYWDLHRFNPLHLVGYTSKQFNSDDERQPSFKRPKMKQDFKKFSKFHWDRKRKF